MVTSSTKTYEPIITVEHCNEERKHCQSYGILTDLFETFQNLYNFTLNLQDVEEWGVLPKVI